MSGGENEMQQRLYVEFYHREDLRGCTLTLLKSVPGIGSTNTVIVAYFTTSMREEECGRHITSLYKPILEATGGQSSIKL